MLARILTANKVTSRHFVFAVVSLAIAGSRTPDWAESASYFGSRP